ncbi:MAG: hypothetical protein WCL00_14825, partial [Bacteroidota bacterium]
MRAPLFFLVPFVFLLFSCNKPTTEYWPNGNKKSEISFNGKNYEGPAQYWFENGNLQATCTYRNNKIDGT